MLEQDFDAAHEATIVLIDLPLWVHFWRAAERRIAWTRGKADAVPAGHPEPPPTEELFKARNLPPG